MTAIVYSVIMLLNFLHLSANYAMIGESKNYDAPPTPLHKTSPIIGDEIIYTDIKATVYHATPEQTDDTPLITADGSTIDVNRINELRWIAVSRDLMNLNSKHYRFKGKLNFGDTVWISYDRETVIKHTKEAVIQAARQRHYPKDYTEKLIKLRTDNVLKKYDQIVGWWVVKDTMGDYNWEQTNIKQKDMTTAMIRSSDYMVKDGMAFKKHYQRKWIDFLQNSKTGMLDYWSKSIIITKKKVIGHNTEIIG